MKTILRRSQQANRQSIFTGSEVSAQTSTNLVLFVSQGVEHPTLGYGAVHGLNPEAGTVKVRFLAGAKDVAASSLSKAVMPKLERDQIRGKILARAVAALETVLPSPEFTPEPRKRVRMYRTGSSYRSFGNALRRRKKMAVKELPYQSRTLTRIENHFMTVSR